MKMFCWMLNVSNRSSVSPVVHGELVRRNQPERRRGSLQERPAGYGWAINRTYPLYPNQGLKHKGENFLTLWNNF